MRFIHSFSILFLPLTILYLTNKNLPLFFHFMCGIEVKISPKQSKKLAERKKTKGKTNGWAERGDETIAVPEMLNGTTYHLPTLQPP